MATLINGNGNPRIYAAQDADLIAALAGDITGIAQIGNKFAATAVDANTISVADGVIVTKEGRRIQLDAGSTDMFVIPTGTTGVTNYYIIGYKLTTQSDDSQIAETFVQLMSSSSETITEDTFREGATDVYVSLYRVRQNGVNLGTITGLLPELTNISELKSDTPWYGTCSTAANTTAKVATTTDTNLGALETGQKVKIKFTYANTASAPTLNVDSKGAKSIKAYGTTAPTIWWKAGDVVDFTYNGTNWIMGATQGEIEQLKSDLVDLSGYTQIGTTGVFYRKYLKFVEIWFKLANITISNTGVTLATLPADCKPPLNVEFLAAEVSNPTLPQVRITITSGGAVTALAWGEVTETSLDAHHVYLVS